MRLYDILASDMVGRNYESRKIANNTYKVRNKKAGFDIAIRLHETDVVTAYVDGSVKLNSGGWKTPTTKSRIDDALQMIGLHLVQVEGLWIVQDHGYNPNWACAFGDGMVFTNYNLVKPKVLDNGLRRDEKGLRLKVRAYAKFISAMVPLAYNEDDVDCCDEDHDLVNPYTSDSAPLNEEFEPPYKDTSDILSHLDHNMYCNQLIDAAMDFVGMNSFIRNAVWYGKPYDYLGRERLCEALGRYLCYRLGLVPVRFVWRSR